MNRPKYWLAGCVLLTGCLCLLASLRAEDEKKGAERKEPATEKKESPRAAKENPERDRPARAAEEERANLHRKIAEVKRRIAELRATGKLDQAAELERDAKVMAEKLSHEASRGPQDGTRRHIVELRKSGGEEAERANPDRAGPEEIQRRLHHLHVAIENLHAAGLHEPAEQLQRQAERMRHSADGPAEAHPEFQELRANVRMLNERLERLEQAVRKLAEHVERKND